MTNFVKNPMISRNMCGDRQPNQKWTKNTTIYRINTRSPTATRRDLAVGDCLINIHQESKIEYITNIWLINYQEDLLIKSKSNND